MVELWAAALPPTLALGVHGPQDVMTVVDRTKVWVTLPETVYENIEPSDCVTIDWPRARDKKARRLSSPEKNFIVGNGEVRTEIDVQPGQFNYGETWQKDGYIRRLAQGGFEEIKIVDTIEDAGYKRNVVERERSDSVRFRSWYENRSRRADERRARLHLNTLDRMMKLSETLYRGNYFSIIQLMAPQFHTL